jgi:hypothetical protein
MWDDLPAGHLGQLDAYLYLICGQMAVITLLVLQFPPGAHG